MSNGSKNRTGLILLASGLGLLAFEMLFYEAQNVVYGPGIEFLLRFTDVNGPKEYVTRYLLTNSYYPPLYFAFIFLVHLLFGMRFLPHVLANAALVAAGAVFLYLAMRRRTDEWAAGLAAALFLLLPGPTFFTKTLAIEQPFLLLIPLTLFMLGKAEGFSKRSASICLGVVAGLGMLNKWTYAAYTIVPFAACACACLGKSAEPREEKSSAGRGLNFALFLLAGVVVSGPWYFGVMDIRKLVATAGNDPNFPAFSFGAQLALNARLFLELNGQFVVAFLAPASIAAFAMSKKRLDVATGVLALVVPLVLFSIPRHLEDRYIYPLCALIPVLAAIIAESAPKKIKIAFWCAFAALVLAGHADSYWADYFKPGRLRDAANYHDGRLVWGRLGTSRLMDEIAGDAARRFPGRTVAISAHPLWTDVHAGNLNTRYLSAVDPKYGNIRLNEFAKFRYREFSRAILEGGLDYILLDCGLEGVCSDEPKPSVSLRPEDRMTEVYIEQRYGQVHRPFTDQDVLDDLAFIRERFVKIADLRLDSANRVWIYARK